MTIKQHLKVFAVGIPVMLLFAAALYLLTLLPLWIAEAPLLLVMTYFAGRLVFILACRGGPSQ